MPRRFWRNIDWGLILAIIGLVSLGMALVYSAGQGPALSGRSGLFARQFSWLGLGVIGFLVLAVVPFRIWEEYSHVLYSLGVVFLVAVFVIGVEREGAKRWLAVGGFQFQPSEMAKLATLLLLARLVARPRFDPKEISQLVPVVLVGLVPFLLILFEPDLGTSLSLPAALIPMLYWAGLPFAVLVAIVAPVISVVLSWNFWIWMVYQGILTGVLFAMRIPRRWVIVALAFSMTLGAAAPLLWNSLKPYQQQRVLTLLSPEKDPLGSGYQPFQSKIAIGSGGLTGKGYLEGTQKGLAFLPHTHTDFIFSVLGEEFGFLGCVGTLLLFVWLIGRGLTAAVRARSRFAGALAVGICSMLSFHIVVNIAMTIGLAPVTGLPLPFLSYGGTFLLATLCQAGLLVNISYRKNEL